MAKKIERPTLGKQPKTTWTNPWSRQHYIYLAAGVAVIVVGFLLLSTGISQWDNPLAVDVAPVVLVLGYCVAIPLAIMWAGKAKTDA
jgi:hypothetical protein